VEDCKIGLVLLKVTKRTISMQGDQKVIHDDFTVTTLVEPACTSPSLVNNLRISSAIYGDPKGVRKPGSGLRIAPPMRIKPFS
jgi:hypothetical protein